MSDRTANILLKIIWMVHFALSVWAIMSITYLVTVPAYWFTQLGTLAFGMAAILMSGNSDSVLMFLVTLTFSVLNDIILISIYQPRADDAVEVRKVASEYRNEYRWALGMSIVNIILKPVSIFVLYFIYRSRANETEFSINIPGFSGLGIGGQSSSNRTGHGQYNTIESAHDPNPGIYGQQAYPYHSEHLPAPSQHPNQAPKA